MTGLAPDPAVPRRDALLRPETMAGVISQRLLGGVPVEACDRVYVKYRVGEDLRVVYRYDGQHVAARTGKRDGLAAPEVGAALYSFPHDRKLTALPTLAATVESVLGATPRLVAWAAEQSATAECRDASGRVVAYAKVQLEPYIQPDLARVRIPKLIARAGGVVLFEALDGRRLDHVRGGEGVHALGAALAALHLSGVGPHLGSLPRFERLDPARLATAADVIARARPDVAPAADRLLTRLLERAGDAQRDPVLVHGDANLRNALLLASGDVALLDLEHLALGPAAADLGQVLAALVATRSAAAGKDLLRGYGTPPDGAALRWYTAASILARQGLPAVSRYRPQTLARLRELLDAGAALVSPVQVAA